ncbi:MAG: HAMP domain-containing sensor histidine kinase, partial [Chloroflexota bacterium]
AIARSGNKASNIVNELLLLANVRKRKVKAVPLDLAHIIEEAQERLYDMIEKSEAKITTPSEWPVVLGYAPWIEEVWVNYISNAIKYGGTPPHMELGFNPPADGQITFWIKDNGPGLTPEEQSKLFTPFTRLRKMQAHGHGLGLSIVRRIVEKLGGQVGVESAGVPGQGTTFTFSLPTPDS